MQVVTEVETAKSRGRIPAHDFPMQQTLLTQISKRISKRIKLRRLLMKLRLPYVVWKNVGKTIFYQELTEAIYRHYYSYNKLSRPMVHYDAERMEEPWYELNNNEFYERFGFWKEQFMEVINNLVLMPQEIKGQNSHAKASLPLGICIILRRWRIADT